MTSGAEPGGGADASARDIADLAAALSDPERIEMIRFLLDHDGVAPQLMADRLQLGSDRLVRHLRALKDAGIIIGRIDQPRAGYALNPAALAPLMVLLARLSSHRPNLADF